MNFKIYITLITFLSMIILSCQNQKKEKIIINEDIKKDCFIPSDGVYKFDNLEADTLAKYIYSCFNKYNVNTDKEGEQQIENWLNDEVFSNKRGVSNVVEWYIDDDDLCHDVRLINENYLNKSIDTVYSRVCNSILQKHISLKSEWVLDMKDRVLWLSFCPNIIQKLGVAYEHEVIQNGNEINSMPNLTTKYFSDITVYLHVEVYDKNKEISDSIITDKGRVFTRIYDDYQNMLKEK